MANLPDNHFDAVVTDPPYHFTSIVKRFGKEGAAPAQFGTDGAFARASRGFMGKEWDGGDIAFRPETWAEALRIMKPGAHLVAFGAPKNYHRLACAIEDAGFEIRDSLMWVFGTGFPKSHNISKSIDKAAGAEREVVGIRNDGRGRSSQKIDNHGAGDTGIGHADGSKQVYGETAPATDAAKQWDGWGTSLKPAFEPIVLARKPLSEKTVAANVLRWGTGALNIDATRVETNPEVDDPRLGGKGSWKTDKAAKNVYEGGYAGKEIASSSLGRWPANLCHDGSQMVLDLFPHTKSGRGNGNASVGEEGDITPLRRGNLISRSDDGSAARFYYSAKASKTDRAGSKHPTVKPVSLMQWLVRLVTPPNGTVLDLFAGSGTTGQAAINEGFNAILIERELEYINDIKNRLSLELKDVV
jgi:site-specific DNA-methyltransferase (adenine-specific)